MKSIIGMNGNNLTGTRTSKIGLGGGCHWCTEAVFQSLKGVLSVEQGYIASDGPHDSFSEAVVVSFNHNEIDLALLLEVHLSTHNSTSDHSMRDRYRSAVYAFDEFQYQESVRILKELQTSFSEILVTEVYPFKSFKPSRETLLDYYKKNPDRPFCRTYIKPKLNKVETQFSAHFNGQETLGPSTQ